MENEKYITLQGGNYYLTQNENDAYRVLSGTVLVYIVPIREKVIGRRSFIYEAGQNEILPGFNYRDIEYVNWCFCYVALEEAEIEVMYGTVTKVLKDKFAQKASIKNYKKEGFDSGLVDQYRINTITEDNFIRRSQKKRVKTSAETSNLIIGTFHKKKIDDSYERTNNILYDSTAMICKYSHIDVAPYEKIKDACGETFEIADIARISHFAYREVILSDGWQTRDMGPLIVYSKEQKPMVCLPKGRTRYIVYNCENGNIIPVSKTVADSIGIKAYMVYRPFLSKSLTIRDIVKFCSYSINKIDVLWLVALTLISSLIGLLTPALSQKLYDEYIPLGNKGILYQFGCLLVSFLLANLLFSVEKNIIEFRLTSRIAYDIQSAVYSRVFNLPESFFRNYDSADLAQRIMSAGSIVHSVASSSISMVVAVIFSVVYCIRMVGYYAKLTGIGFLLLLLYSVCYYFISMAVVKQNRFSLDLQGDAESKMFQFLNGISKIRIAGVEDRALYEYMKPYTKIRNLTHTVNNISSYAEILTFISGSFFTVVFYALIIKGQMEISLGTFVAFETMFGAFTSYFLQIVNIIASIRQLTPSIERLQPILKSVPEMSATKELPGDISGEIEINNVSFAYTEDTPDVLQNINLTIKAGEYVGIVGTSGCGKSTLLKLLLGFEKPKFGKIYYDNKDIENVDKCELRKKMGVVLQNGKLISGSVYENISITAPNATNDDVMRAVKAAGLENDIAEMPMGLQTVLSEDCGTISGGQQQRILIARAIISNPKIVFFDEATSALDNITQKIVTETVENMSATRIVIAHRLSTIIRCDRIIVLDKGRVVEQGTYDELLKNNGLFYQLVSRQTV